MYSINWKIHFKGRQVYCGGNKKKERFLKNELLNCDEPEKAFSFGLETWNKQVCPKPTLEDIKLQVK